MGIARTAVHLHDRTHEHAGHAAEGQARQVAFGKPYRKFGDGVAVRP